MCRLDWDAYLERSLKNQMNSGQSGNIPHHRAVICRFQTSRQLLYIVSLVDSRVMELALGPVLFDTVIGGGSIEEEGTMF